MEVRDQELDSAFQKDDTASIHCLWCRTVSAARREHATRMPAQTEPQPTTAAITTNTI